MHIVLNYRKKVKKMYKQLLLDDGIAPQNKGFIYLNDALKLYEPGKPIMELYDEVAEMHESTRHRVERAMRHSIQKCKNPDKNARYIATRKMVIWADVKALKNV